MQVRRMSSSAKLETSHTQTDPVINQLEKRKSLSRAISSQTQTDPLQEVTADVSEQINAHITRLQLDHNEKLQEQERTFFKARESLYKQIDYLKAQKQIRTNVKTKLSKKLTQVDEVVVNIKTPAMIPTPR